MKKVLITGGSGYFGETLLDKLLSRGYECSVLDINLPDKKYKKKIEFFQIDIRDYQGVLKSTKNIDCVFHNVAQVPLAKNKDLFETVNNLGTNNILKAAKENNCKHLIYTSSSAIYGVPLENPVTEATSPNPIEEYGRAKLDGEKACLNYKNDMNITIVRPRTILGKGRLGVFQILFEWVFNNQNIPVFDGGRNMYQFVHCDDLAKACILAFEKEKPGLFNIGSENYCSMSDTLEALIVFSKKESKIRSLPSKFILPLMKTANYLRLPPLGPYHAAMYGRSLYFDLNKAKKELNWESRFSNKDMIIESYQWYVENRDHIKTDISSKSLHKSSVKQGILSILGKLL